MTEAYNELYSGCSEISTLKFLVKLMHIKVPNGWSQIIWHVARVVKSSIFNECHCTYFFLRT